MNTGFSKRNRGQGDQFAAVRVHGFRDSSCGRSRNDELFASLGDRPEILGLEAGAADQRAVDLVEAEDLGGVLRVDRTAVKDARASGNLTADRAMHAGHVGERWGPPGADRPDRLVGNDETRGVGALRHGAGELAEDNRLLPSGLTLGARLADAEDRDKPGPPRAADLGADFGIALAVPVAALGMAENDVCAAGILQHLGADISGEGALLRGGAILAAQRDNTAAERGADRRDKGRRRTNEKIAIRRSGRRARG